jgi:hypothetical protein
MADKTYSVSFGTITYDIKEQGYNIYLNGNLWIQQYEPYIPDKTKTYEENAILQIEQIINDNKKQVNQIAQADRIEQALSYLIANNINA